MKLFSQLLAVALLSSMVVVAGCDKAKNEAQKPEAQPAAEATVAPEGQQAAPAADAQGQQAAPAAADAQQAPAKH